MKSTRVRVILAAVAAGVTLTACSPSQVGTAAIVGGERISSSELNAGVKEFEEALTRTGMGGQIQTPAPQAVLGGLISIEQISQLGERNGVTVTETEIDDFLTSVRTELAKQGRQLTDEQLALNNGLPPSKLRDLVRISIIQDKMMKGFGAGEDEASRQAASQKFAQETQTIKVVQNPRYAAADPQDDKAARFGVLRAS
ncbi:SurA N-terminal domain-containing protein [Planomonospora corallina]|uniref:SurA N-terminal domain-containing protein n=1 Tax=Planomonospora corallina TaxID=1806052 RepID=A0ABV8I325_9ACTN